MRIAFYAPLKHPGHPSPSGDRRLGRLFIAALEAAGHQVEVVSTFRSLDRTGDAARQQRLTDIGARLATRLIRRPRWDLWFTYHLYHRAPDHLGPAVATALGLPYVVAEASIADKQADGAWAAGYRQTIAALKRADRVIAINPTDIEGVHRHIPWSRVHTLAPFLDIAAWRQPPLPLPGPGPWLVAVGMFRDRAKLQSYQLLGDALARLRDLPWQLAVIGAGPAEAAVRDALAPLGHRVHWLGARSQAEVAGTLAAADLMVWPAINEALGMALLEAQASGLGVVAGDSPGVRAVIAPDGAVLCPLGDAAAFAAAVRQVLTTPGEMPAMGGRAAQWAAAERDVGAAAMRLNEILPA